MFDQDKLEAVVERIKDALRPIGITIPDGAVQAMAVDGETILHFACQVRDSAFDPPADQQTRDEFADMMKAQNQGQQDALVEEMRTAMADPDALEKLMGGDDEPPVTEDTCLHVRRHPDGFCLDCSAGLDGEPV